MPLERVAVTATVVVAKVLAASLVRLSTENRLVITTAITDMPHRRVIAENQRSEHQRDQSQVGPVIRGAAKDEPKGIHA